MFERAGELGMPVAIHCGDPKAFWKPATPDNERWDELQAHPEWSFAGSGVPSWQELYDAFERRVARHPKTTFIAVHFGDDPEDPDNVGRMLDRYPNFFVDTAARVPEIGRQPQDKMRRFFIKYQDRILFGTDTGIGADQEDMMYGSNGAPRPPARTRSASSPRPGAISRRWTARSRARPPSKAAGRSTASGCPSRSCARSTSTMPPDCCAGDQPALD